MAKKKQELESVETQTPAQQTTYNQNNYIHIMEMAKITQPLLDNPDSVREAIEEYFMLCQKNTSIYNTCNLIQLYH